MDQIAAAVYLKFGTVLLLEPAYLLGNIPRDEHGVSPVKPLQGLGHDELPRAIQLLRPRLFRAREILRLRARLNEIYVKHTGQPLEVIASAVERDRFLTPLEAKEFGLVDEVVEARPTTIEERARA